MKILFCIIGMYLGAITTSDWHGALFGLVIGYLFGAHLQLRESLRQLQEELKLIKCNLIESRVDTRDAVRDASDDHTSQEKAAEQLDREATTLLRAVDPQPRTAETAAPGRRSTGESVEEVDGGSGFEEDSTATTVGGSGIPSLIERAVVLLRHFFTSGNVVVKIGVIILFFGVGFLVRYAVDRQVLPIEMRLIGIAAGAIVMLVLGWRLRHRRAAYALVLQGGAVGIMYINVFATAKTFGLISPAAALLLMILLVTFSAILAYVQDSRSLAIFGMSGGFIAPILTSTGSGSHVMLFSYYALLNAGIFGMAWVKSWRALNLVGFVFTFVIGAAWGIKYYQPQYFSTTEPFLILFFLFYLAIAVLFAHRQAPQLKGVVDATLVFGVPLVGFTLQAALVADFVFGRALSALCMAAIYIGLARVLWNRQVEGMRLLTESFLALGVIFASLAIPFALDGRWSAATWALEGAAAVWVGLRQDRLLTRNFGLLLQVGASLLFLATLYEPAGATPLLNSAYVACLFTSLAGLFTAFQHFRQREVLRPWEQGFQVFLLGWGVVWWLGAGLMEIDHHLTHRYVLNAGLLFFSISFLLLDGTARRLQWQPARFASVLLLPAVVCFALLAFVEHSSRHPFANLGYLAWPFAFVIQYRLLYRNDRVWQHGLLGTWHISSLWLLVFMISWVTVESVKDLVIGSAIWGDIFWGLVPALAIPAMVRYQGLSWPLAAYRDHYFRAGFLPLVLVMCLWLFIACFIEGRPRPLAYLPLANPLELAQLFILFVLLFWILQQRRDMVPALPLLSVPLLQLVVAVLAFIWLNSVVGRTVHFFYGVRFDLNALFHSAVFQASISIVWTMTALSMTVMATRYGRRRLWFVGVVLIAVVSVKLFLIDLKDTGTIERIISFLTVGILLSVIGYLSPLPPGQATQAGNNEKDD